MANYNGRKIMSSWDNFKNIKSGGGTILKPEENKTYKIRVIGEPYVYTSEFKGTLSTRFAVTIYNQTDEQAQVLMLSKTAFGDIYELVENPDWGNCEEYDIAMKRTGSELETRYSFAPAPKRPLEEGKKAEVEAILLEDVLSRLPSVQQAFPLSQVNDPGQLLPKKSAAAKATGGQDVEIEDIDMPSDFLQ